MRIERPGLASRHALLTVHYDELFVEPVEDAEVRVNDRPISGYTRLWKPYYTMKLVRGRRRATFSMGSREGRGVRRQESGIRTRAFPDS